MSLCDLSKNPTVIANKEFQRKLEAARNQIRDETIAAGKRHNPNFARRINLSAFGIVPPPPKKFANEELLSIRVVRLEKLLKRKDKEIAALKKELSTKTK